MIPYFAPLAAMPTSSNAPKFADMNAKPVIQAGMALPDMKKSALLFIDRFSANPIPNTKMT